MYTFSSQIRAKRSVWNYQNSYEIYKIQLSTRQCPRSRKSQMISTQLPLITRLSHFVCVCALLKNSSSRWREWSVWRSTFLYHHATFVVYLIFCQRQQQQQCCEEEVQVVVAQKSDNTRGSTSEGKHSCRMKSRQKRPLRMLLCESF